MCDVRAWDHGYRKDLGALSLMITDRTRHLQVLRKKVERMLTSLPKNAD